MLGKSLRSWVGRLKGGDQSAFLPLYERTAPGLMRFLLWKTKGDKALSEDILQESYVRFLLHLDSIQSDEDIAIQTYLLRIVKHCLIDKTVRSPQQNRTHVPIETIFDLPESEGAPRQEQAVELRELSLAMGTLNEKDSEIIWLRDALGLSHREVADRVGISEEASRQAYVRAKRALMRELGRAFGVESPQGASYATP